MNLSIRTRLLASATLVLVAFFGIVGVALERGFHASVETAVHERLQAQVYALLAAADLQAGNTIYLPNQLPEPRLSSPESGLLAEVTDQDGNTVWHSRSMLGIHLPKETPIQSVGTWVNSQVVANDNQKYISTSFVASYAGNRNQLYTFRFRVAENYRFVDQQVARFRKTLWSWLGVVGVLLLAVQGTILRWSLAPLERAELEIAEIEKGNKKQLSKNYPRELTGLTERLNLLVDNSDKHLQRYRDSLGNLAHSLKTPLAVLKNAVDKDDDTQVLRKTAQEQIARMIDIVNHQLQRAATSGRNVMAGELNVGLLINKIGRALTKVYADKGIAFALDEKGDVRFSGDEGDFMELAGNLMDNAFKWCRSRVNVTVSNIVDKENRTRLVIKVDDDGPGIPEKKRNQILQRGKKADENMAGQGLGFDMILETVSLYNGSLKLLENDWGGLRVEITI